VLTLARALRDPSLPVGTLLPVSADSVPLPLRREQSARADSGWREVYCPTTPHGEWHGRTWVEYPQGCRFGCKLLARRQGAVVRYAVLHSLTYGHSHSPSVR
jgi:hypothetical protein